MRNLIIFLLALVILLALPFGLKAQVEDTACCGPLTWSSQVYGDGSRVPCPCDTERFYWTVDTCLTCPEGWTLTIHDSLWPYFPHAGGWERWCVGDSTNGCIKLKQPDTTITTTVRRKVEVWLRPEDATVLPEIINCWRSR